MSDDPNAEPGSPETDAWASLGETWRAGGSEPLAAVDSAEIARRARRFAGKIRLRNAGEWAACGVLIAVGAVRAVQEAAWPSKLSDLGLIAVALWVGGTIAARGRNLPAPSPAATTAEVLAHERAQLERQRVLLLGVRRWYLGPSLAWVVLTVIVRVLETSGLARRYALIGGAGTLLVTGIVFVVVDRLNARAARDLARKLSQLG